VYLKRKKKKLILEILVQPNTGTQHKVQGHNDVYRHDLECEEQYYLHALVL
jgi:hypothetical protein